MAKKIIRTFTPESITEILATFAKERAAGRTVKEIAKEQGIAISQYYAWSNKAKPKKKVIKKAAKKIAKKKKKVQKQTSHDYDMTSGYPAELLRFDPIDVVILQLGNVFKQVKEMKSDKYTHEQNERFEIALKLLDSASIMLLRNTFEFKDAKKYSKE